MLQSASQLVDQSWPFHFHSVFVFQLFAVSFVQVRLEHRFDVVIELFNPISEALQTLVHCKYFILFHAVEYFLKLDSVDFDFLGVLGQHMSFEFWIFVV